MAATTVTEKPSTSAQATSAVGAGAHTSSIESSSDLLAAAVDHKLGAKGSPRRGQQDLCDDVADVMSTSITNRSTAVTETAPQPALLGRAKTGTGKSLGYLAPAMFHAAKYGHRTVVSTKDLALQRQIVDQDAPHINAALDQGGYDKSAVTVLKGFSNYVCPRSLMLSVTDAIDTTASTKHSSVVDGIERLTAPLTNDDEAESSDGYAAFVKGRMDKFVTESQGLLDEPTRDFYTWATTTGMDTSGPNVHDLSDYPHALPTPVKLSATQQRTDCPAACPLAAICPPNISRQRAADADVIVTNHTFLAIQAAVDAPVIVSNKTIGPIDHLIIDEAHELPAITRKQASGAVSSQIIGKLASTVSKLLDDDEAADKAVHASSVVRDLMRTHLGQMMGAETGELTIDEDTDPTEGFRASFDNWATTTKNALLAEKNALGKSETMSPVQLRRSDRLASAIRQLAELRGVLIQATEHRPGRARWIAKDDSGLSLNTSAVGVAKILGERVFTGYEPADPSELAAQAAEDAQRGDIEDDEDQEARDVPFWRQGNSYPLSVTCVSATLPGTFPRDIGLDTDVIDYASVFDDAYAASAFFSPRVSNDDGGVDPDKLCRGFGRRKKLDYAKHRAWSIETMTELIRANGGSALVLATSAQGGKAYAHALRSALDVPVYDQWSSAGASVLRHNFTSNESSVLVATRGMMTGLDVPGDALSLVIIDRIPRAPMNAVDNARADLISSDGVSGFLEQDDVYGSDAAVLLEQAAGRLIRSITDTGMVALLDPRVSPKSDLTNKRNPSYRYYKQIIKPFGTKLSSTDDAVSWLAGQFSQRGRS